MTTMLVSRLSDSQWVNRSMDYARQVWLAGLGAVSKAEKEGNKLFEVLVERGEQVQAQARKRAEDKVEEVKGRVEAMRDKATDNWNKLEQVFRNRVVRVLQRLGVPTPADVQALSRQVEVLQTSIQELIKAEEAGALSKRASARSPVRAV